MSAVEKVPQPRAPAPLSGPQAETRDRRPPALSEARSGLVQRKCACGSGSGSAGECGECRKKRLGLQAKSRKPLAVAPPGDRHEREADRAADRVVSSREPADSPEPFYGGRATPVRSNGRAVLDLGNGHPLPERARHVMERGFRWDFSGVRIHSDEKAADLAQRFDARAFTLGSDIVFGRGEYDPASRRGEHLLAHELAHVVQQSSARTAPQTLQRAPTAEEAAPEEEVFPEGFYACDPTVDENLADALEVLEEAKRKAALVAGQLRQFRSLRIRRHFRKVFGDKSEASRNAVAQTLEKVAKLEFTEDMDEAGGDLIWIGCADCSEREAFFRPPRNDDPPMLGFCPQFFALTNRNSSIDERPIGALKQLAIALHEMIHAVNRQGAVDIYDGTRLFAILSKVDQADGSASLAVVNPDSIVVFVLRSLARVFPRGEEAIDKAALEQISSRGRIDSLTFFGDRRTDTQIALGLVETWALVGEKKLADLADYLRGIDFETSVAWDEKDGAGDLIIPEDVVMTALLLSGGEVAAGGAPACNQHPGFPISCPQPGVPLVSQDLEIAEKQHERLETVFEGLRETSLDELGNRIPRPLTIRRRRRAKDVRFKSAVPPVQGSKKGPLAEEERTLIAMDTLHLPDDFFTLPTYGDQAERLARAMIENLAGTENARELASFMRRNAERPDQDSAVTLGELASRKPRFTP